MDEQVLIDSRVERPMIFPGMDPWLEDPQLWPGVHHALIIYLRDQLRPRIHPRYIAAVEDRVYVEGPEQRRIAPDVWIQRSRSRQQTRLSESAHASATVLEADEPDVVEVPELEVHEPYLEILDRRSGQRVVTVIEVVSPSNKSPGTGRNLYVRKQQEVLRSSAHIIEIDLLRAGQHVVTVPEWAAREQGEYDYLVCVNRASGIRERFELYRRTMRDRLPTIRVPLADDDPDVPLEIQAAIEQVYEAGNYLDRIDYRSSCQPPLRPEDQEWADKRLAEMRVEEQP